MISSIIGHGSLRPDSEDSLYGFIRKGMETNGEMFGFLEFVRFEYCSTDVMNNFFELFSKHLYEINASIWAGLRARLILPQRAWKHFPPLMKKGNGKYWRAGQLDIDVRDGIFARLTTECRGNVHDCHVVQVTCGSFEKETYGPIHTRGHMATDLIIIQRMLLI
jgi:hypothetical protein